MAPQPTRSAIYCGVVMSRNSQPAGNSELVDPGQQMARDPQALVDVEAAVEIGIVDQALPADGGARLLEIDAHDDLEPVVEALARDGEPFRIFDRRIRIMDRAGADHHGQAIVLALKDVVQGRSRLAHGAGRPRAARKFAHDLGGCAEFLDFADAKVVCRAQHGRGSSNWATGGTKKPPVGAGGSGWFLQLSSDRANPFGRQPVRIAKVASKGAGGGMAHGPSLNRREGLVTRARAAACFCAWANPGNRRHRRDSATLCLAVRKPL